MSGVKHHPEESLLVAHAAGLLDLPMMLIVATHMSFCTHCRDFVASAEQIGGALLDQIAPVALAPAAWERTLERLEEPPQRQTATISNDNTPGPLRVFLGRDISHLRWRKMGPRLGYVTLYRKRGLALRLLRGTPGSDVGQHTHRGLEYTLVLRGGYTDETGSYGPGDFQSASPEVRHNPIADPEEDCINLSVTTDRLRFDSALQNLVGWLFGF